MCGRDSPKMEADLGGTDGEKTVSIELSANPCFFPVMWFPPESIAPLAHRPNRLFTLDPLFLSVSPSFPWMPHASIHTCTRTHTNLLPQSCELGRISVPLHNLQHKLKTFNPLIHLSTWPLLYFHPLHLPSLVVAMALISDFAVNTRFDIMPLIWVSFGNIYP